MSTSANGTTSRNPTPNRCSRDSGTSFWWGDTCNSSSYSTSNYSTSSYPTCNSSNSSYPTCNSSNRDTSITTWRATTSCPWRRNASYWRSTIQPSSSPSSS